MRIAENFREIWAVDFEFHQPPGERPDPICMVAHDILSGRTLSLWIDDLRGLSSPPYGVGPESLFVAYYASADLNCHLALGWGLPANVLDLYAEFRLQVNGLPCPLEGKVSYGLVSALRWCGLDAMSMAEKDCFRQLAIRGGPFNSREQADLLKYCEADVMALPGLLEKLDAGLFGHPGLDLHGAVIRGEYVKAIAAMESRGIPIDERAWNTLEEYWPRVIRRLIGEVDQQYGVYKGMTFKETRFVDYLREAGIPWEWHPSGKPSLTREFFKDMADAYPELKPLHELRTAIQQMRDNKLAVGADGRNRALLGPFGTVTGRNAHKAGAYIFGQASWLRALIRPEAGKGLAYLDWSQQEYGIAAILSGDQLMIAAYESGDPYLAFARACKGVPDNATRSSHPLQRDLYKQCVLGTLYGIGAKSLALRINKAEIEARWLLTQHRNTYRRFWQWAKGAIHYGSLHGILWTRYGWEQRIVSEFRSTSLQNFPVQGSGADMLRLACIAAEQSGVKLIGTLHDAILIEFDLEDAENAIRIAKAAMAEASRCVLDGFELRTEVKTILFPDRYVDVRGVEMWNRVWTIIGALRA